MVTSSSPLRAIGGSTFKRERPRDRVSESDGEERWFQDANRNATGFIQSGAWTSSFGVKSKTFKVETEKKKGKMQIFIVERKRGVSSWIKLRPASLGPLMEGLVFCTKDTRTEHWEKLWQENGRTFSLVRGENKGGCFLHLGVVDREKKRFSIFIPKGRGAKGGWALLVEALREVEVVSERQQWRRGGQGESRQQGLKSKLEEASPLSCWLLDPKPGRGDNLRSWGTQMAKSWGLKGDLGLAKLENGKALLEFEVMTEAEKALKVGEVSDILSKIGEECGGFLDIDAKTERMEELQWARILVKINDEKIPNMVEIWAENMRYSLALWWETRSTLRSLPTEERGKPFEAIGEVEGEVLPREGKRVMEAEGGPRLEDQTQSADGT
ncbi:hypothetical protein CK203_006490 [Vitis vinifera]|uniref:DUF4283 domain-containing protein n=1 Tax=Vitis vinifera TaxID=29760 RepID=A0A438KB42_VITVI|nr:hypothetical protein CK203_006490 [Vitis vinifera]